MVDHACRLDCRICSRVSRLSCLKRPPGAVSSGSLRPAMTQQYWGALSFNRPRVGRMIGSDTHLAPYRIVPQLTGDPAIGSTVVLGGYPAPSWANSIWGPLTSSLLSWF